MMKWSIAVILLFPVAEIAAFVLVASLIGVLGALALMLATTATGILVLRQAGRGGIARLRVAMADGDVTGIQANTGGFLTVFAGVLLFLPGFLTDLIGAALLIAPVRRWCGRTLRRWLSGKSSGDRSVVDLAPGEWKQVPDREIENGSRQDPSARRPRR